MSIRKPCNDVTIQYNKKSGVLYWMRYVRVFKHGAPVVVNSDVKAKRTTFLFR